MKKWSFHLFIYSVVLIMVLVAFAQLKPLITKSDSLTLTVGAAPTFTLELDRREIHTFVNRTISFTAEVVSINDFAGDIRLSLTGVPPEYVNMIPSLGFTLGEGQTKGIHIDIMVPDNPDAIGSYVLTLTAESDIYN